MAAAKKKRPVSYHLVNFGIGFLGLFAILPLIWTFYTSLRSNVDINKFPTKFSLSNLSFDAYFGVWRDTNFPMLMKNSLIVSTMTVIISLALGTFAGYALSRSKFRGRQSVLLVYLAIRLVPGVLLLIPMYLFMNRLGLLDSYIGLTLAYLHLTGNDLVDERVLRFSATRFRERSAHRWLFAHGCHVAHFDSSCTSRTCGNRHSHRHHRLE
jgi:multiple sugar transport system permease protein